ncbi:MAG: BamA/TamA family outer membrane protein, partial [Bacteroidota bacterium]|nr:BamA/TamA family outer membrane protein [Bacteroidota bacterium]
LQPQSPRLNLGFNQPYFLRSKYGLDFTFDLQKRDSSYLQLNSLIGIQFTISDQQYGKIFYQSNRSFLLAGGIDTNRIITYKVLPPNIDVSSGNFGIDYHFVNTNYRLNPRKGNELEVTATAGLRKVIPNSNITNLKDTTDPGFNFSSLYDTIKRSTYRLGFVLAGAHYFPMGKNATLKTALHVGVYQSPQIFRNELFLIGGYQLLRGFDEESIYATRYAVFTAEYHYLIGVNSYIFGFSDWGFTRTKYTEADYSNSYISGGLGLEFETKFGLLNLSYAMGKRNDLNFDIRTASKIHFGYVTYF